MITDPGIVTRVILDAVHATTRTVMFVAPVIGEKVVARFPVRRRYPLSK